MDQDEALRLHRGGAEGIKEWNQRRGAGEVIPALGRADLEGTDLGRANLGWVEFQGANLQGADLRGARPQQSQPQ